MGKKASMGEHYCSSKEPNLETKYKELVERLKRIEDDEVDALARLEEHCPSSMTKFIETFAAEFGARAVTYLVLELLMKGLK